MSCFLSSLSLPAAVNLYGGNPEGQVPTHLGVVLVMASHFWLSWRLRVFRARPGQNGMVSGGDRLWLQARNAAETLQ